MSYTVKELRDLAMKEQSIIWTKEHFQKIYTRLIEIIPVDENKRTPMNFVNAITFSSWAEAVAFAKWGKDNEVPIYHVCEGDCTVARSFMDLYKLESER